MPKCPICGQPMTCLSQNSTTTCYVCGCGPVPHFLNVHKPEVFARRDAPAHKVWRKKGSLT